MDIVINFPSYIDDRFFYEELLIDLASKYKNTSRNNRRLIFDFQDSTFMSTSALPLLMSLLEYLRKFHNEPAFLKFPITDNTSFGIQKLRFRYFLDKSKFLYIGKKRDLFLYDSDMMGGYEVIEKNYRIDHVLHSYSPDSNFEKIDYEDLARIKEYKDYAYDQYRWYQAFPDFGRVLSDSDLIQEESLDIILNCISELIVNAQLYSSSYAYAFAQTKNKKTVVSVCDAGVGLNASLQKKDISFLFEPYIKDVVPSYNKEILADYFIIIETLNYSKDQDRANLWSLKELIIKKKGKFKIHYNSTQVIFDSKCINCDSTPYDCGLCMIKNYSESLNSPLKLYPTKFTGVHIEAEIGGL